MDQLTDEELIARFQTTPAAGGGHPFVNELFQRYYRKVALWALRFTGDREAAADLAQEIFTSAYRNLGSFRGEAKFSTWLYVIARNHCMNTMRSAASRQQKATESLEDGLAAEGASPYQAIETAERTAMLRRWMAEVLDETEQRVLALHLGEDMPLDTVTRVLALRNASGAKAFVVSARRKLQKAAERWKAREAKRTVGHGEP